MKPKNIRCTKFQLLSTVHALSQACIAHAGCFYSTFLFVITLLAGPEEVAHKVDGEGEDDGGVVFGRDAVQCLQISELKKEKSHP